MSLFDFFKKKRLAFKVFSPKWKLILSQNVRFYQNLDEKEQYKFEERCLYFLNHVRIKGIQTTIQDEDYVFVAASAVIPTFGFKKWFYPNIKQVLIFPTAFNEDLESAQHHRITGMVGTGRLKDSMCLAQDALGNGFKNPADKKNVGIHEFVHLIDMADGKIDGIPEIFMQNQASIPWIQLMENKLDEVYEAKTEINPYGGTSHIEFLTVCSEYFFERPKVLKEKHPKIYEFLEDFFVQEMEEHYKTPLYQKKKDIGRNDPCLCGSGKKYKKCCLNK